MPKNPSWDVNIYSSIYKTPIILGNPEVNYIFHIILSLIHILYQINSAHALRSYFLKIYVLIIYPSTPKSFKWSLPFGVTHKKPACNFLLPHTCPCHTSQQFSVRGQLTLVQGVSEIIFLFLSSIRKMKTLPWFLYKKCLSHCRTYTALDRSMEVLVNRTQRLFSQGFHNFSLIFIATKKTEVLPNFVLSYRCRSEWI